MSDAQRAGRRIAVPAAATQRFMRDIDHSLPLQLLKAREAAMSRFRPMLKRHGLTEQQWRVIRVLAASPRIDASELARRSYLLPPSLTRILRYCEGRKLITREGDTADQRRAVFELTAKGERLFMQVGPDSEALYGAIAREFGIAKLETLYALLAEFSAALNVGPPAGDETLAET